MEIIEDKSEEIVKQQVKLASKIVEDAVSNVYECCCGVKFRPSIVDIENNMSPFMPIKFSDIGVHCPRCRCWHQIGVYTSFSRKGEEIAVLNAVTDLVYTTQKEIKKQEKLKKKEAKKNRK